MKVSELKVLLEDFREQLRKHQELWGSSLGQPIPNYPVKNTAELRIQSDQLSRMLGRLQPFFSRFRNDWTMQHAGSHARWNALEAAVGIQVAAVKGPSLVSVIQGLDLILGQLDNLDLDDDVPGDPKEAIRAGGGLQKVALGYLDYLHPFIKTGCSQLYLDGHHPQAIEEAVKAVFQYLRDKTALSLDGASLVDKVFSPNAPMLKFSDLSTESLRNEQVGFMEMLKGFLKGVRHPLAHSHGNNEDAQKAFEYLVMASLFCRRIDDANP